MRYGGTASPRRGNVAIQIPGRCGSTGDFFVSGVRSVFLRKTDLTQCTNSSGELSKADPPRHPTECLLLLLPLQLKLLQQVPGCKPCRKHTSHTTGILCCPRFRYGGVDMIISASE